LGCERLIFHWFSGRLFHLPRKELTDLFCDEFAVLFEREMTGIEQMEPELCGNALLLAKYGLFFFLCGASRKLEPIDYYGIPPFQISPHFRRLLASGEASDYPQTGPY
jgi:hypothetical protein